MVKRKKKKIERENIFKKDKHALYTHTVCDIIGFFYGHVIIVWMRMTVRSSRNRCCCSFVAVNVIEEYKQSL